MEGGDRDREVGREEGSEGIGKGGRGGSGERKRGKGGREEREGG